MTVDPAADGPGALLVPVVTGAARPDPRILPHEPVTRFAPAPTGLLHLGHLVNALYTWGIARATGGRVILRVEDHDRQRSRPEFEVALLEDMERLGLSPDEPPVAAFREGSTPYRQSDAGEVYAAALERLRGQGLVYACACSRATFAAYAERRGRPYRGIGCPGDCRTRALPGDGDTGLRVAVGAGSEPWVDLLAGPVSDEPAATGDLLARDRAGNWTLRLLRGRRRREARRRPRDPGPRPARRDARPGPPGQAPRARGAATVPAPPARPPSERPEALEGGRDTSLRSMLDDGRTPAEVFGVAARLAGLREDAGPVPPEDLGSLFTA